jgi:hypothetical protein
MANTELTVRAYDGSALSLNAAGRTRICPGALDAAREGLLTDLTDNAGKDAGVAFDGSPAAFIGVGTLQATTLMIGPGDPFPVVVFVAGGKTWIGFPDGQPVIGKTTTCELRLSQHRMALPMPLCLAEGTRIRTPYGDPRIENLKRGDTVMDHRGQRHTIHWIGHRDLVIPLGLSQLFARWLPIRIPVGSFGEGHPYQDLLVSAQHRILLQGRYVEEITGERAVLAEAGFLTGDLIGQETGFTTIRYYHVLCDRQIVLLANGLPVESLLPGDVLAEGVGRSEHDQMQELFPQLTQVTWKEANCRSAAQIVDRYDARLIAAHQYGGLRAFHDAPSAFLETRGADRRFNAA